MALVSISGRAIDRTTGCRFALCPDGEATAVALRGDACRIIRSRRTARPAHCGSDGRSWVTC